MKPSAWLLALALLGACSSPAPPTQPEPASGWQAKSGWKFSKQAVATAHPLASEAGALMLSRGGNAVDAAVAAQMVLALVEPQSSGIGGGGFLVLLDGKKVRTFDGRETAPAAASAQMFSDPSGRPLPRGQAVGSQQAVGVPGLVPLLWHVHRHHGRLPWPQLLKPAIDLAERGFPVGQRLHTLLQDAALARNPEAARFYLNAEGKPWPIGHTLRNPALAAILKGIAQSGPSALLQGPVGEDFLRRLPQSAMQLSDLRDYRVLERDPICADWQQWRLCGMGPPASGTLLIGQMLGLMQRHQQTTQLIAAPELHLFLESARLGLAERDRWVGDPDFTPAPPGGWNAMLSPEQLNALAAKIGPRAAGAQTPAGRESGTTHLSVIDAQGQTVSLTSSVESVFGTRLLADGGTGLAGGYFLNNQLTDFSSGDGPNRIQGGKRPRSSMSPLIVQERNSGAVVMSLGAPGGSAIPQYVVKVLLATLGSGLSPQAAIDLPNVVQFGTVAAFEKARFSPEVLDALRAKGHRVQELELTSGVQAVQLTRSGLLGGADPRREGSVAGE